MLVKTCCSKKNLVKEKFGQKKKIGKKQAQNLCIDASVYQISTKVNKGKQK